MEKIGIICEYNPLHNGHIYHINKVKELYPDSIIILILNGYFTERGEVSILSKENKTLLALQNNVDIVLELPFVYGTQSADIFAEYSINTLNKLGVKKIIFGSECNDINKLNEIVLYTINNSDEYNNQVKEYLNTGLNYPTAMAKALNMEFDFSSNDLLGISYIKAIKNNGYDIEAITIKRTSQYLDIISCDDIISASNIREKLSNNEDIHKYVPKEVLKYIENISINDYFDLIKYKIITSHDLSKYLSVDEGIDNRLKRVINSVSNIDELISMVKSKRYTYNKISRMLIHILIGLTKEDNINKIDDYIKVLGFNETGKKYLNSIKKDIDLSLNKESIIYKYELVASSIYNMISKSDSLKFDQSNKPIYYK